ncbi:cGMP-dependent protein kinase 1 [Sarotherodon galilaeus]
MVPQLYITVYNEQFRSPGTVKRAQLRPTSAHRRNNPQPRADFLFPRSLQSNNRSAHALLHPLPPVDFGRPLFPPVRHFSFHGPVTTCSDSYLNTTDKTQHMPPVNPSTVQAMPSADKLQKLQLTEPSASTDIHLSTALKSPQRQNTAAPLQTRALTPAAPRSFARTKYQRCCSNSSRDNSGCYSCFHVVKPYQAGHYIIHPEFVSESLY